MKVILYMAISANGMIAKNDDDTNWISKEEWDSYSAMVRKVGAMVIGRRTYEILTKQPEFSELKDVRIAVVSRKNFQTLTPHHMVASSPREALEKLKDFKKIIVAGGGMLNTSFMEEGLVDEIYLDVEPIAFGSGIPVFREGTFEKRLKLIGTKKITENEIQLRYKVVK